MSAITSSSIQAGKIFYQASLFRFYPSVFQLISTKSKHENVYTIRYSASTDTVIYHQTQPLEINSNSPIPENQDCPTLSYLLNNCGFPLDSAILVSRKLHIESTEKPDYVLQLFQDYNFTQAQIISTITKYPEVLIAESVKTFRPKFEVLESVGFSKSEIAEMVSSNSRILSRNFTKHMTPFLNKLKGSLHNSDDVIRVLLRWCCRGNGKMKNYEENIAVLRHYGVPDANICKLIIRDPNAITQKNDWFKTVVEEVERMRFEPSRPGYFQAIVVMCTVGEKSWKEKSELYKSYGWSDEDFMSLFKAQSNIMRVSVKKITKLMDFYINDLGFTASHITKYPHLIMVSYEQWIMRRCSVVLVLLSHGFIGKDINLMRLLTMPTKLFEEKFVNKYRDSTPEVLKAYHGDMGFPNVKPLRDISKFRNNLGGT